MSARIPLRRRDGSVRAWTLVDDADYEDLAVFTWHLHGRYAARNLPGPGRTSHGIEAMARRLVGLQPGDKRHADHINRDKLDNRRSNLRILRGQAENGQNRPSNRGSASQFRGVSWHKDSGRWQAAGRLNGKAYHLGSFRDEATAGEAAAAWRREHMPFSAEAMAG